MNTSYGLDLAAPDSSLAIIGLVIRVSTYIPPLISPDGHPLGMKSPYGIQAGHAGYDALNADCVGGSQNKVGVS